jgi:PRTRC genetic system protein B
MRDIGKSYVAKNSIEMEHEQLVGDHLIHASNRVGNLILVWWRPAMRKVLNFDKHLKIKSATVNIPAMLFVLQNTSLYLFALMDDTRPVLQTKLYHAPFYNIYDDARVCMGTAPISKIKAKTFEKEAERFERAFFMAEQTGGISEKRCKTPLGSLWRSLIGTNKVFPAKKELVQHPKFKTLGTILNRFIDNSNDED